MKASYLWLQMLAPGLPGPKQLAARLTAAGIEVEALHEFGAGAESCVLAWVVSVRPHPTKSGVTLVTVDRGGGLQEVVCGAPNVPAPGGVVVLAPLGTHLPAKGMTIARRDIAGVVSEGMLCSEAELGLSDEAAGIIVFPPGYAQPGARFTDVVPEARDTIFEIGLTPNRPDCLGHVGLAREAAALVGLPFAPPAPESPVKRSDEATANMLEVHIEDPDRCPHYGAAIVTGATLAPSPVGVRYRLSALGVRPISNAVDVTNTMMLWQGHPMHAFDADKLEKHTIIVRRAKSGEELVTLDDVTRKLDPDDLVIADAKGPMALAGVMGGLSTEISAQTKRIILECAYFDPRGVRRAARRYGLHSESSHRFERGIDYGDTARALEDAVGMTCRLTGGVASKDVLVVRAKELPAVHVTLREARITRLLGVAVPRDEAKATLERLGFTCTVRDGTLETVVPSHRPDVTREVDVIEEVIRVRGIDTVPGALPAVRATRAVGGREALLRRVRHAATSIGLFEALTFGFTSRKALEVLGAPAPLMIGNPLTEDLDAMRTSLLPGLLDAVRRARRRGVSDVRLFTTGSIFLPNRDGGLRPLSPREASPRIDQERASFAAVLAGERPAHLERPKAYDVWDASGLATALVPRLVSAACTIVPHAEIPHLHPRGRAEVHVRGVKIGVLGPLHPDNVDALDLGGPVMVVELDLDALAALEVGPPAYTPIPRHPAVTRDIALIIRDDVPAGDVLRALRDAAGPLATDVKLFDRFVGGSVPQGHASLAFHVVYQAPSDNPHTLTDIEVDASHQKVVAEMQRRFGASLRA